MFDMENKSQGIAWVGDIYQKFEAMCMEMDDMVSQETLKYVENQLQTVSANVQQFCSELIHEVLPSSPTKSVEDLNSSLVQNAGITTCEDSKITVDEDHSQKELIHSSSLESAVNYGHFGLSSEQSKEDKSVSAHCSGSIPSDPLVAINNHLRDIDSTLDDNSLVSTEEVSHKSVSKVEPESVPFPTFNKTKLEESCILVDRSELQSLSNEARKRRSYKKKISEAFSSKPWLGKSPWLGKWNNEQFAESSEKKGNGVGLSRETNKYESLDVGFSESDWEII